MSGSCKAEPKGSGTRGKDRRDLPVRQIDQRRGYENNDENNDESNANDKTIVTMNKEENARKRIKERRDEHSL